MGIKNKSALDEGVSGCGVGTKRFVSMEYQVLQVTVKEFRELVYDISTFRMSSRIK